jgi:hypothetical protein
MAKEKNSPKKTATIFDAMTKAMVKEKPKPKQGKKVKKQTS